MSVRYPVLLAVLPAVLVAGCVEYEYVRFEGVDVFYQDPAAEVDILLMVDNSCSMEPHQQDLAQNFNEFISFFTAADVDYHIGVITTTIDPVDPITGTVCTRSVVDKIPLGGHLVDGTYITPDTENVEDEFSDLVNVGDCGSGFEMGLESAYRALYDEDALADNGDFLRDEASLSLIFVANEQDYSPLGVNEYINAYRDVKGQRVRDVFNASALVVQNLDDCSNSEVNAGASVGSRYLDVAKQTSGIRADLCAADLSSIVTDLSLNSSRLNDTFILSDLPATDSIQVTVDEDIWDCADGKYSYDLVDGDTGQEAQLTFARETLPPAGSQITIRYNFGDGNPDDFCSGTSTASDTASGT